MIEILKNVGVIWWILAGALLVVTVVLAIMQKPKKTSISVFAIALLAMILPMLMQVIERKESSDESGQRSTSGELQSKKVKQYERKVNIELGTNHCGVSWDTREPIQPLVMCWGSWPDLWVKFDREGRLKVSAKLMAPDGRILAEIVDNEWEINPGQVFKRNYNDSCLEIINVYGTPSLQITFADARTLIIRGMIPATGNYFWLIDERGMSPVDTSDYVRAARSFGLRPMFKYPAATHLGELAQ